MKAVAVMFLSFGLVVGASGCTSAPSGARSAVDHDPAGVTVMVTTPQPAPGSPGTTGDVVPAPAD